MKVSELTEIVKKAYDVYITAKYKMFNESPIVADVVDYDWVNFDISVEIEGCGFSYEGIDMSIDMVFCDSMDVIKYLETIGFKFGNITQNKLQ